MGKPPMSSSCVPWAQVPRFSAQVPMFSECWNHIWIDLSLPCFLFRLGSPLAISSFLLRAWSGSVLQVTPHGIASAELANFPFAVRCTCLQCHLWCTQRTWVRMPQGKPTDFVRCEQQTHHLASLRPNKLVSTDPFFDSATWGGGNHLHPSSRW